MAELEVSRLERLEPGMLAELAHYGRESLGDAALDEWTLPVIAAWGLLYVARRGGEVVGSAQIIRCFEVNDLYMDIFYIRPPRRGLGYGTKFLCEILERLGSRGFRRLLVTADSSNLPAVALYEKAGFREAGSLPAFYGQGEDRLLLAARLADGDSV